MVDVSVPLDHPVAVVLSDEERQTGTLSGRKLYEAITVFNRDGVVVLENAMDTAIIDQLNARMIQDTKKLLAGHGETRFAGRYEGVAPAKGGNLSSAPPLDKESFHPEIYANLPAVAVLSSLFGPKPELRFIRTNTLLNTQHRQIVHKDTRQGHLKHPFAIAMNVCLVDCDASTGSTELWLGTARDAEEDDHVNAIRGEIKQDCLEARRRVRPPIQPRLPKGSVVLRDVRLWHAGMPNPTDKIRVMLAMVWFPSWFGNENLVTFPESMAGTIAEYEKKANITIGARYIPDKEYDHLNLPYEGKFFSRFNPPDELVLKVAEEEAAKAQLQQ